MDKRAIIISIAIFAVVFILYKTFVMKKTTGVESTLNVNPSTAKVGNGVTYNPNTDLTDTSKSVDDTVNKPVDEKTAKEVYNETANESDVYFSTPDNATLYEFISKFGTVDKKDATSARQAKNFKMIAKLKGTINGYIIKTRVFEDTNALLNKNKYWIEFGGTYRRFIVTDKTVLNKYIVK